MRKIRYGVALLVAVVATVAAPAPLGAVGGFGDVPTGTYFAAPVQWMVDRDITTGTTPCSYSPHDVVTRGQAAAFVWRMEGRPRPDRPHPFNDVQASWQQDPVSWMFQQGVTTGTSSTTYSPDDPLTRGQFAAMLHRLAGSPGVASGPPFVDVPAGAYYAAAVAWMSSEGLTTGTSPTTFSPNDPVTRAQVAAFLYRYQGSPRVVVTTDGDCNVLPGDGEWPVAPPVLGRRAINRGVDYDEFGSPWYIHDVDITVNDGGNGVEPAETGPGLMINSSVVIENGADNIKIAEGGVYRNLYLRMSDDGGHIDAMQSQGNSDWVIDNVVIEMTSHNGVTGAILIENLRGGGGGYADVTGTINRVKLIGSGPYGHDIRLQNNTAADMTVTVTNIEWGDRDSVLLLTGSPGTLTVYVDDSVPPSRISNAEDATIIRI